MNDDQARTEGAPEIEAGDAAVLDLLMAQERRALDPYFRESDPSAYVALFADEATYFDPWSAARLGGGSQRSSAPLRSGWRSVAPARRDGA